jgi:CubicO group peptidase (beta-lactamase class C family)
MAKASWIYQYEAYAGKIVTERKTPGASVGFALNGVPVYEQGFGFRNAEEGLPATATTVHGIGSATKSFTAVAIMQLQERGKLKVHDPVVKYLPEFRTPNAEYTRQVTIHHFLTHSAGLPPLPSLFPAMGASFRDDPNRKHFPLSVDVDKLPDIASYEELMAFIAGYEFEPLGAPGTRFSYSNDGYGLLGAIIERLSGMSYNSYVEESILKPAGMADSTFDVERLLRHPEITQLYGPNTDKEGAIEAQPGWWQSISLSAAGFLRSTVPDMLRYMEIYRTGGMVGHERILTVDSVQAMTRPQIQCSAGMHYGYGMMITKYHGATLVEHGGAVKGVAAQVMCVPERGITGVALTNVSGGPATSLAMGGVNALMGLPLETKRVEYKNTPVDPARLPEFAGEYTSMEGAKVLVKVVESKLVGEMRGKEMTTRCVGVDTFAVATPGEETSVTFLRDDSGKVTQASFGFRILSKVS